MQYIHNNETSMKMQMYLNSKPQNKRFRMLKRRRLSLGHKMHIINQITCICGPAKWRHFFWKFTSLDTQIESKQVTCKWLLSTDLYDNRCFETKNTNEYQPILASPLWNSERLKCPDLSVSSAINAFCPQAQKK